MNLTVAIKIIGGFTIITILLIISSASSYFNMGTINESTTEQNELAIPTLRGSNLLALELSKMGNSTLSGYYQTELGPLSEDETKFSSLDTNFSKNLQQLKATIQGEATLTANLRKVDSVYKNIQTDVTDVFSNRRISIEKRQMLVEQVDILEEKADEAATLLLDLADHDLADTKLQKAVGLGEHIETLLNAVVSSSFEYRDALTQGDVDIVGNEINNSYKEGNNAIIDVMNELNNNGVTDIADELSSLQSDINDIIAGGENIFTQKQQQLAAIAAATEKLLKAEQEIDNANAILAQQVDLANKTTVEASKQVDSAIASGTTLTIIIALVSIVAAVGITWFTVISITRPLSKVNEMLNIVASGDLSRKLDESGKDEFAQLAKNCNLLIDSLRNLIQSIVSRSTQLAAAAEQTSAVTAQSTTAIEEQRNQVEQAASATTEMSSTSQSVLSSANDALGEIKQADDEAERVKTISERNRATIELLANEVESASQVINKLQQDSASIGGILDVIRGIAEQTNLLALNAAIEAARAGEQGRGFAVVADEVRTLASRTQESTQEIQNMIEVLQTGAEKAVSVMSTGKTQAANCVEQSEEADKALETITHAVHEAFDRSSQIATAAEEQSVVAHEISENLESIVAIAEQTTAGSQQTASSSSEVARLSEELQQSVQEFKI
jgi:methyl-accepting chemotaxis protein